MPRHRLLVRQIKRHLGFAPDAVPPEFVAFLEAVDSAYQQADDDRRMIERSLELSSAELLARTGQIQGMLRALPDTLLRVGSEGVIGAYQAGHAADSLRLVEPVVGRRLQDTKPEAAALALVDAVDRARSTSTDALLEFSVDEGPDSETYEVRAVPLAEGETFALVRSVTERHRVQKALERAAEAAEASNRAKSAFLANMSHELRTPLNAILGYTEMVMEEAVDTGADDLLPDLGRVRSAGKLLLDLINDVLDLSKIEAGKMELHPEPFDLVEVARELVATAKPLIQNNGNTLRFECESASLLVRLDLVKTRQVILNLLSNAAKFTERGTVTFRIGPSGDDRLRLEVTDTGIGMSEKQIVRLFSSFTQVHDSPKKRYGGTGLGLVISKRFCQMMGGEITVESTTGLGSTFSVDLPREIVVSRSEAPPAARTA